MLKFRMLVVLFMAVALVAPVALADSNDSYWDQYDYFRHSELQAVNDDGTPAFDDEEFPLRLVGVVLNNNEDWLDPTADHEAGNSGGMGGQAEIFVQAVDLDGTDWDPFPGQEFDDFGGTACWMGQNYSSLGWVKPGESRSDQEWAEALGRLNLEGGDGVTDPIRAGELVEIRARAGMHFGGKMNVNEQHTKSGREFEIVRLDSDYGLPDPHGVHLSDLKYSDNEFIFCSDRAEGGERYQSTWIELQDLYFDSGDWAASKYLIFTDGDGRDIEVRLGHADGYDWSKLGSEWGSLFGDDPVSITGILNQSDPDGTGGYYLVALGRDHFVPEPMSLSLMALGGLAMLRRRRR